MTMYVLDTDHLSVLEWGGKEAEQLTQRLAEIDPSEVATTIISFEEQSRGWMAYLATARTAAQQVLAYSRLERHLQTFCAIPVLGFSDAAGVHFARLRKQHRRLGTMDLKIAAICPSVDAILLTRNVADFEQIREIRVEDWTR
jgi:tRNA(fMet)-specific endonuclease VapC